MLAYLSASICRTPTVRVIQERKVQGCERAVIETP
jgi:hypothetical protein